MSVRTKEGCINVNEVESENMKSKQGNVFFHFELHDSVETVLLIKHDHMM